MIIVTHVWICDKCKRIEAKTEEGDVWDDDSIIPPLSWRCVSHKDDGNDFQHWCAPCWSTASIDPANPYQPI